MSTSSSSAVAETLSMRQILGPLTAIIIGIFMVILDGTAVNVALPQLMKDFKLSDYSVVQWTVTGYALAQAAVIPLAGWLSDRFGAKRIFRSMRTRSATRSAFWCMSPLSEDCSASC